MKHKKIRTIFVETLAVLILTMVLSCTKDFEINQGPDKGQGSGLFGKNVTITLALAIPAAEETKGLTSVEERNVRTVDILLFDKDSLLVGYHHGESLSANGNTVYFEAQVRGSQNATDKFIIMALTNSRDVTSALFSGANYGGHEGETYRNVCALLKASRFGSTNFRTNGIPMWGEVEDMVEIRENFINNFGLTLIRDRKSVV